MPKKKKMPKQKMSKDVCKKALLLGLNYQETKGVTKLKGCINDVGRVKQCLMDVYGFLEQDIIVLTDTEDSGTHPSAYNIASALFSLITSAKPGDVLFVYFSGHGDRSEAKLEDNDDTGFFESIIAADGKRITDDHFRAFVDSVHRGCSITILADCCHSGSLIEGAKEQIGDSTRKGRSISRCSSDFESDSFPEGVYAYVSDKSLLFSTQPDIVRLEAEKDASPKLKLDSSHLEEHDEILEMVRKLVESIAGPSKSQSFPNSGILLSACQGYQTAKEVSPDNPDEAYGVFTDAILSIIQETNGRVTNRELVQKARKILKKKGFRQKPGLYCSNRNASKTFLL